MINSFRGLTSKNFINKTINLKKIYNSNNNNSIFIISSKSFLKTTTTTPSSSTNSIYNKFNNNNRFYSTNNNNNNNKEKINNEQENEETKSKFNFEFLKENKRKILYSFGIGLGLLSSLGGSGSGNGNDDEIKRDQKVYYKFGVWEIREKHLVMGGLLGVNALVFALLKNPTFFQRYAYHFFCSASSIHRYPASLILSTFTHTEPFHFIFNMYALTSFGSIAYDHLGTRDFLLLYFLGGLVGSMTSLTFKLLTGAFEIPSIGASGCVFSVLAASVFFEKDSKLGIIFLPISFDGLSFLHCIMLFDLLGCLIRPLGRMTGWDHACHLGSAITGYFFGSLYTYKEKFQHFNGQGKIVAPNFIYTGGIKNGQLTGFGEYKDQKYIQKGFFNNDVFQAGEITFRNSGEKRNFSRPPPPPSNNH